jgi:hypothetical protein
MKASRAYITSLGTTGLLLSFALLLLVVVSAIMAFRAWPGDAVADDSAAVRIDSGHATELAPVRFTTPASAPRTGGRAAAPTARRAAVSRDRGGVQGVSESGAKAPAAPAAATPTARQAPAAAPGTPRVGQVSTGLADTTWQVTQGVGGALESVPAAPVHPLVSGTGQAVSDVVRQTGDSAERTLP